MQFQMNIIRDKNANSRYEQILPRAIEAVNNWTAGIYKLAYLNVRLDVPNDNDADHDLEASETMSLESGTQSLTDVNSQT